MHYGREFGRHADVFFRAMGPTMRTIAMSAALSLIHISEPTRPRLISYAVFCLKKKILHHESQDTI